MPLVDCVIGRFNALEIIEASGRLVVRRYLVGRVDHGRDITSAEANEGPAEELELPLSGRQASAWLYEHFEDLTPVQFRAAHARLTRPFDVAGDAS